MIIFYSEKIQTILHPISDLPTVCCIWMETVKLFVFISFLTLVASSTTGHVLSSRSDPSVRDRLPKIEMNATSHSIVMTFHPATIPDGTIKRFRLQYGINFPYQHSIYINKNQTSVFVDKLGTMTLVVFFISKIIRIFL